MTTNNNSSTTKRGVKGVNIECLQPRSVNLRLDEVVPTTVRYSHSPSRPSMESAALENRSAEVRESSADHPCAASSSMQAVEEPRTELKDTVER